MRVRIPPVPSVMTTKLKFGETVVAKDDYPGNVHIRTNEDTNPIVNIPKYAVFDDIKQVSGVFYARNYEACKAYAEGYVSGKETCDD